MGARRSRRAPQRNLFKKAGKLVYRFLGMPGYNPSRRNRNIGTAKSGHGQNNRMTIPKIGRGEYAYWESIEGAREVDRIISGRVLKFFVQPTLVDCVHACTVADIARLMAHVPLDDWEDLGAVVLRQPRRKEQTLAPVWGRLSYAADLVNRRGQVRYRGPAIIIEAVKPAKPLEFGRSLSPDDKAELDRLNSDGHQTLGDKNNTIVPTLESCRSTQLYRTLLHELGHWVDHLEKVDCPASKLPDIDAYGSLLEKFHSRPDREREEFAHSYAKRLSKRLLAERVIPFDRQVNKDEILAENLRLEDFVLCEHR
jgi:hypothetical protein